MAHFVADHPADRTIVDRVVIGQREEWRLQDCGREDDLVARGIVIGVHRLREHEPLVLVDRLAETREVVSLLPGIDRLGIGKSVVGAQHETIIGLVLVGVADLRTEGVQLGLGLSPGGRAHPRQLLEVGRHRYAEIADQLFHRRLVGCGEITLGIDLAGQLADRTFDCRDRPLPPRALLRLARQGRAIEGELGIIDPLGEDRGLARDIARDQPGLPVGDRFAGNQLGQRRNPARKLGSLVGRQLGSSDFLLGRRDLGNDDFVHIAKALLVQRGAQRHFGREGQEISNWHLVVSQVTVAAQSAIPVGTGHLGFELENGFGGLGRIGIADLTQDERQVSLVLGHDLAVLGAVDQVIVAVRQAKLGLPGI